MKTKKRTRPAGKMITVNASLRDRVEQHVKGSVHNSIASFAKYWLIYGLAQERKK